MSADLTSGRPYGDGEHGEHGDELADLSAYLLGALSGAERDAVRAHLSSCARCQRELLSMAPLPGLLSRLRTDPQAQLPPLPPPPVLRERIVNQVIVLRRRQRSRSRALIFASAAAGIVLVAGTAGAVLTRGPAGSTPRAPAATLAALPYQSMAFAVPVPGVTAQASVVDKSWGTAVDISGAGWPLGAVSVVAVVTADGTVQKLGSWSGTGAQALHCAASTWVRKANLRAVQILDHDGRLVAQVPVTT